MIRPGLVSITFRPLSPAEIIGRAARAGLEGIEWGGDMHVPPGGTGHAREVAARTRDAGLEVAAYGSYYRLGAAPDAFPAVLEAADALGARLLRVWAGGAGSAETDTATREAIIADGRRIAALAGAAGITVVCEWHGGTLTDTADSATALLEAVDHPAFRAYWQPRRHMPFAECLRDMDAALPRLAGLHVFQWHAVTGEREPLEAGASVWPEYLRRAAPVAAAGDQTLFALLEFVRGDDPEQMARDAATLRRWLEPVNQTALPASGTDSVFHSKEERWSQ